MGPVNPKVGFSYTAPTQATDGSAFPANKIAKYQIGLGQAPGVYTLIRDDVQFENGKQTTPFSVAGTLAFGQWYAAARAVSTEGTTSAWSNEAAFVLEPATPNPPLNFEIA